MHVTINELQLFIELPLFHLQGGPKKVSHHQFFKKSH